MIRALVERPVHLKKVSIAQKGTRSRVISGMNVKLNLHFGTYNCH